MQNRPANWSALLSENHAVEWEFIIGGVTYTAKDIQGTPVIEKPMMAEPVIGRCCTGLLSIAVRQQAGKPIPKAAPVIARCRLKDRVNGTVSGWLEQGHYWVSQRKTDAGLTTLTCRDGMILAGRTYSDKTAFIEWPVQMKAVLDEIVSIMGVELDPRTEIETSNAYRVDYPNEDMLMSEILAYIAAAHGGNFVMTETGKLRLVPFPTTQQPVFDLVGAYQSCRPLSTGEKTISRITLTDSASNQFTIGDDSGVELTATCEYATQAVVDGLGYCAYVDNSTLYVMDGKLANGTLTMKNDVKLGPNGDLIALAGGMIGRTFWPYELVGAYLDPCIEVGDTISILHRGVTRLIIAATLKIKCSPFYVCSLSNGIEDEDEEEVPYTSPADLAASRYISTTKTYHGNRINRTEGFVSELMENDEPVARMVANSNVFAMQRKIGEEWEDVLYFDPVSRQFRFRGEVDIGTFKEASATSIDNNNLVFAADASGKVFARSYTCNVFALTGEVRVVPQVSRVTGAVSGMQATVGAAVGNLVPITVSVTAGADLGSPDSNSGTLSVFVTFPLEVELKINWCKVNTGVAGAPGTPGKAGDDGATYYTWVKYADTPTSGMSDSPEGKKYIGIAYNKATPTASTNYADYSWSLIRGADGSNGYNNTVIQLYQRAASASIATPSAALTFTFSKNELSGSLGAWSRTIPDGTLPCYTTSAAVYSINDVVTIPASAWTPVMRFVSDGANGTNGENTSFVYLYQRAEEAPATPSEEAVFTFATGNLTGKLGNWTQTIPNTNGNPCWVTTAYAAARTATVSIPASAWSAVAKIAEDGEAGARTFCQDTPPADAREMDLWIDTSDNYKLYRYDGEKWVSVQDANIPDILEQLVAAETSLKVLSNSIESAVSETYVTNQLNSLIETFNSTLSQTSKDLTATFSETVQNATGEITSNISTLIRASGDGVEVGKSDSNFKVLLSNDRLSFRQSVGGSVVEVAYMSNRKLFITEAQITSELAFGADGGNRFVWTKTSTGLSLRYVSA